MQPNDKPTRSHSAPIDWEDDEYADEIDDQDDDAEMAQLVLRFVDELRTRADALEASLAQRDLPKVGGLAHQLVGSARAYGFPRITEEAAALETSVRAGRCLDEIRSQVATVAALCREARA